MKESEYWTYVEEHDEYLRGIAENSIYGTDYEAGDALHDAYLGVYNRAEALDENQNIVGYIGRAITNKVKDHYRRGARISAYGSHALEQRHPGSVEKQVEAGILLEGVETYLSTRSETDQEVMHCCAQRYSHSEISKELDLPVGTVKTKIRSIRKQLKELM